MKDLSEKTRYSLKTKLKQLYFNQYFILNFVIFRISLRLRRHVIFVEKFYFVISTKFYTKTQYFTDFTHKTTNFNSYSLIYLNFDC
jgi:hypothetical protein